MYKYFSTSLDDFLFNIKFSMKSATILNFRGFSKMDLDYSSKYKILSAQIFILANFSSL